MSSSESCTGPTDTTASPQDVREFYDHFLHSRMLDYRVHGNRRLDAAIARASTLLHCNSRVLDVGCGIGVVAESLARCVPSGTVIGIDISERNIWYARHTVRMPNVSFAVADVVEDLVSTQSPINGGFDVILLVDVIEHIHADARPILLKKLRALASDGSLLLATYPSPQYQRFLHEHNPAELQILDNVIEIFDLANEALQAGYHLKHYSIEDVWTRNQYCHAIFQTDPSLADIPAHGPDSTRHAVFRRLEREFKNRIIAPLRRRKYIDRVFGR